MIIDNPKKNLAYIHSYVTKTYNKLRKEIEEEFPHGLDYGLVLESFLQLVCKEIITDYIMMHKITMDNPIASKDKLDDMTIKFNVLFSHCMVVGMEAAKEFQKRKNH